MTAAKACRNAARRNESARLKFITCARALSLVRADYLNQRTRSNELRLVGVANKQTQSRTASTWPLFVTHARRTLSGQVCAMTRAHCVIGRARHFRRPLWRQTGRSMMQLARARIIMTPRQSTRRFVCGRTVLIAARFNELNFNALQVSAL